MLLPEANSRRTNDRHGATALKQPVSGYSMRLAATTPQSSGGAVRGKALKEPISHVKKGIVGQVSHRHSRSLTASKHHSKGYMTEAVSGKHHRGTAKKVTNRGKTRHENDDESNSEEDFEDSESGEDSLRNEDERLSSEESEQ